MAPRPPAFPPTRPPRILLATRAPKMASMRPINPKLTIVSRVEISPLFVRESRAAAVPCSEAGETPLPTSSSRSTSSAQGSLSCSFHIASSALVSSSASLALRACSLLKTFPQAAISTVAVDLVAQVGRGHPRRIRKILAVRRVQDRPRRADHQPRAVGGLARGEQCRHVAALRTDAGHQKRHITDERTHLGQLLRPGRADHEHAIAVRVPFVRDLRRD